MARSLACHTTEIKAVVCSLLAAAVASIPVADAAAQRSIVVDYVAPKSASMREYAGALKSQKPLELIADAFEEYLELPTPVRVSLAECEETNAFYRRDTCQITLCYELMQDLGNRFVGQVQADELFTGTLLFIASHEFGHAVFDVLGLPVLGREEGAADQLAALAMIKDPEGAAGIVGAVEWLEKEVWFESGKVG